MAPRRSLRGVLSPLAVASLALPASAPAHQPAAGGAAAAPARPDVSLLKCASGDRRTCPAGELLAIRGEDLRSVDSVVFLGAPGRSDDRKAAPRRRSPHRLLVQVPGDALSGRLRVVSRMAGAATTGRRLEVTAAEPTTEQSVDGVFPVDGAHRFGTWTNRFGGGRGHKGQDIFATCGTPVVAALGGRVTTATYEGRAGHHVVVSAADGTSQVYMHMLRQPLVKAGETVAPGTPLGAVGESGSAEGCHLHFELWTAPGWYRGGQPVDPLPTLRQWDTGAGGS
jgi:murein DD-endopeptidase MepM/ murein hydrolase activator NlpD